MTKKSQNTPIEFKPGLYRVFLEKILCCVSNLTLWQNVCFDDVWQKVKNALKNKMKRYSGKLIKITKKSWRSKNKNIDKKNQKKENHKKILKIKILKIKIKKKYWK